MAGITLEQAQAKLEAYLAAEDAVLTGQSYELAGRRLTRANLADIRQGIQDWNAKVQELTLKAGGSSRARAFSPGF